MSMENRVVGGQRLRGHGVGKMGKGFQEVQASSCEMKRLWGHGMKHGD